MLSKLILTIFTTLWIISHPPSQVFSSDTGQTHLINLNISCSTKAGEVDIQWSNTKIDNNVHLLKGALLNTNTGSYTLISADLTAHSIDQQIPSPGVYKAFAWVTKTNISEEKLYMSESFDTSKCSNITSSDPTPTVSISPTPTVTATPTPTQLPTVTPTSSPTTTPTPTTTVQQSSYITRNGATLLKDGQPWKFTGYNNYMLPSDAQNQCGSILTDAQISSIMSEIATASKGSVIRTWFFQSYVANGNYAAFDRVLSLAYQHGIKVIPVLENQWGNCEQGGYKSLSWYQSGYTQTGNYPLSFEQYVKTIVNHYKNSTDIAFWQIMNEAEAKDSQNGSCNETAAASAMTSFANTISQDIKNIDQNHLVSLGTMGSGQCGTSGNDYKSVQSGPNLDILEYHDYNNDNIAMPGDAYNGLSVRIQQARDLNKPIFIGEAGIRSNVQSNGSESGSTSASSITLRADDFKAKMDAQFNAGISGYLIWVASDDPSDMYAITPGDPTEKVMATY